VIPFARGGGGEKEVGVWVGGWVEGRGADVKCWEILVEEI